MGFICIRSPLSSQPKMVHEIKSHRRREGTDVADDLDSLPNASLSRLTDLGKERQRGEAQC